MGDRGLGRAEVHDRFVAGVRRDQGGYGKVGHCPRVAPRGLVDRGDRVVGEERIGSAVEGFYRVVEASYEKRSLAISSNIHPSKAHRFRRRYALSDLKFSGTG